MIPNPTRAEETYAANKIRSSDLAPALHWPVIGDALILWFTWRCTAAIKRLRARGGVL
jgi:hypothetical protein